MVDWNCHLCDVDKRDGDEDRDAEGVEGVGKWGGVSSPHPTIGGLGSVVSSPVGPRKILISRLFSV